MGSSSPLPTPIRIDTSWPSPRSPPRNAVSPRLQPRAGAGRRRPHKVGAPSPRTAPTPAPRILALENPVVFAPTENNARDRPPEAPPALRPRPQNPHRSRRAQPNSALSYPWFPPFEAFGRRPRVKPRAPAKGRHPKPFSYGDGWRGEAGLAVPDGVRLVFQPAYTPEVQQSETLLTLVDEPVVNKHIPTLEALENMISMRCAASPARVKKSRATPASTGGRSSPTRGDRREGASQRRRSGPQGQMEDCFSSLLETGPSGTAQVQWLI